MWDQQSSVGGPPRRLWCRENLLYSQRDANTYSISSTSRRPASCSSFLLGAVGRPVFELFVMIVWLYCGIRATYRHNVSWRRKGRPTNSMTT